jgi:hypothetical protein
MAATSSADVTTYRELVGSLMYLAVCSRPDVASIVSQLARYMQEPALLHWKAAKHVLRYLRGTAELGLHYRALSQAHHVLNGYADASYGDNLDNRRSTTGYIFMLNGAAISWSSRLQQTVANSTAEAEYMSLAAATLEAIHLRGLLCEAGYAQDTTVIFEDNQPAIHIANNPITSSRSKHIDVRYHIVRERTEAGEIQLTHISTENMIADALTKDLDKIKFTRFRSAMLGYQ